MTRRNTGTSSIDLVGQVDAITPDWKAKVHAAVFTLSSHCDGAHERDFVGFNGTDAPFGNMIAQVPPEAWSDAVAVTAFTMLATYRRQLLRYGIHYDDIPRPPDGSARARKAKTSIRALTTDGERITFHFGYDAALVSAVRQLPESDFDRVARTWSVPASRRDEAMAFAALHGFGMADAVKKLRAKAAKAVPLGNGDLDDSARASRATSGMIEGPVLAVNEPEPASRWAPNTVDFDSGPVYGDELVITFGDYDRILVQSVRSLPSRRFDGKSWRVPTYLVRPVMAFAKHAKFKVTKAARAVPDSDPEILPVTVTINGAQMVVRFPYNAAVGEICRGLGGRWHHASNAWRLAAMAAPELLDALDGLDKVTVVTNGSIDDQVQRAIDRAKLSRSIHSDYEVADFELELAEFQRAGVEYAMRSKERADGTFGGVGCFVADPVGLGKTRQALAIVEEAERMRLAGYGNGGYPALYIPPNSVIGPWVREASLAVPHRAIAVLTTTSAHEFGDIYQPELFIAPFSVLSVPEGEGDERRNRRRQRGWLQWFLTEHGIRSLIVDESQAVKEFDTNRTRAAVKLSEEVVPPDGVRLCLTATPVLNQRYELGPQLKILGRLDEFGGAAAVKRDPNINAKMRAAGAFLRRKKKLVMPNLPDPAHRTILIPRSVLDPKALDDYAYAETELLEYLGERAAELARASGLDPGEAALDAKIRAGGAEHLVKIGVLKMLAARAKLPAVKAWTQDMLDRGEKLLIFAGNIEIVDALGRAFDAPVIKGEIPPPMRLAIVDKFQAEGSDTPLVVLGLAAGGVGLTMTAAHTVVMHQFGWTPAIHDQAAGRAWGRMNDPHGVDVPWMVAEGTIDHRIQQLIEDKRIEVNDATDGADADEVDDNPIAHTSVLGDLVVSLTHKALGLGDDTRVDNPDTTSVLSKSLQQAALELVEES